LLNARAHLRCEGTEFDWLQIMKGERLYL
jgi:hypothetical protein